MTKAQLIQAAQAAGVSIKFEGGEIDMDAPPGRVFFVSDTHNIHVSYGGFWDSCKTFSDAMREAASQLSEGIADCQDDECEYCHLTTA